MGVVQASSAEAVRDREAAERERAGLRTAMEQLQAEAAGAGTLRQQLSGSGDMASRVRTLQQRLAEQELQLTTAQADSQVGRMTLCPFNVFLWPWNQMGHVQV